MSAEKTPPTRKASKKDPGFKKRSQYVVDRKFQARYFAAWLTIAFWIVFALGFFYITASWLYLKYHQNPAAWTDAEYRQAVRFFVAANVVFILFLIALIGMAAILHSHRIAGACYRMKTDLTKIRGGDSTLVIQLRKSDFLQDLADEVNDTVRVFRSRLRDQERRLELAKDLSNALSSATLPPEIAMLATEVGRQLAVKEELPLDAIEADSGDEEE